MVNQTMVKEMTTTICIGCMVIGSVRKRGPVVFSHDYNDIESASK